MDPELARLQAEYERMNVGHAPRLPEHLSEAQLDGRACTRCGDERAPRRPVSSQLFECLD